MLRLSVSALASLLLGCVCAAQEYPEMRAERPIPQTAAQRIAPPKAAPKKSLLQAPKPSPVRPFAQVPAAGGAHVAAATSAAGQVAIATPTPKALLPLRPPRVSYSDGMLGIVAENSTLADVLSAVRQKTGASIEAPPSAASERVVISIGPAPANAVLTALLNGSRFDYIILGSQQGSGAPQQLILREKQETAQAAPQGNTQAYVPSPPQLPAEAPQPEEDYIPEAEMPDEVQPEPQVEPQPGAAGQPNQQQQQPGQQQVKTPEQLLEELKLMQQQQQQQQQGHQPGAQPQQENDPNARPQNNQDQQQLQPQMPPDGEAPPD